MGDLERFEPTPEQRAWLDSLSPERRHEMSEALHANWYAFTSIAESMDNVVELMLPHGTGEGATNFLTASALHAEAFRAAARGEHERAAELFASAVEYQDNVGEIEIVVLDEPTNG
ncbi:MAG TPA: hypothetical protein VHH15_06530 [Actinophytocola sp.]|nr:hypothetical protein [Actinophytocola sp.]